MMKKKKDADTTKTIVPVPIKQGECPYYILGVTPLVYNAMSFKVMCELLKPKGRKTTAEKATSLKHDPLKEFRDSVYRRRVAEIGPTRLLLPSNMFKAALAGVAKRVPGSTTAEMKQLVWVDGDANDLYGVPQLFMSVVRNSDISRTPDVRTRAIVPQWCCAINIKYVQPQLSAEAIGILLQAAGMLNGVGDYRQEKGAGNYGQFEIANGDDPRVKALIKNGGIKAQDAALKTPTYYDQQTEDLMAWFEQEIAKGDRHTTMQAAE